MARATLVKKARQDYPQHGIKKGESYYWWKFRHGSKQFSKTAPRISQLTGSDFLSQIYSLSERIEDLDASNISDLAAEVEDISQAVRDLGQEQSDKRDNMPESLQDSDTGQLLEGRQQSCEDMADEIDGISIDDLEREGDETDEDFQDRLQEAVETIISDLQAIEYQGE